MKMREKDTYWWIETKRGLATLGREIDLVGDIIEGGGPNLFYTRRVAKCFCRKFENPVKVQLKKIK